MEWKVKFSTINKDAFFDPKFIFYLVSFDVMLKDVFYCSMQIDHQFFIILISYEEKPLSVWVYMRGSIS
ncbi:hypothetical protein MOSE0_J02850 [Monosporozyma servazzii]